MNVRPTSPPRWTQVKPVAAALSLAGVVGLVAGCSGGSSAPEAAPRPTAAATSCAGSSSQSNITVPIVINTGGQASPVAAAVHFAKRSENPGVPVSGWTLIATTKTGDYLRSGTSIMHAVKGPDGTWQVDREMTCLS